MLRILNSFGCISNELKTLPQVLARCANRAHLQQGNRSTLHHLTTCGRVIGASPTEMKPTYSLVAFAIFVLDFQSGVGSSTKRQKAHFAGEVVGCPQDVQVFNASLSITGSANSPRSLAFKKFR